jgi:hypothetical protein
MHLGQWLEKSYFASVTAAERVIQEIRNLPPADLREVYTAVLQMSGQAGLPTGFNEPAPDTVPPPNAEEQANEAAFLAAIEEARRLWGSRDRDVPNLD